MEITEVKLGFIEEEVNLASAVEVLFSEKKFVEEVLTGAPIARNKEPKTSAKDKPINEKSLLKKDLRIKSNKKATI